MLGIIKIIVPILTSLAVCYITLYFSDKRNAETLKQQRKNHIKNLEISEKNIKSNYL